MPPLNATAKIVCTTIFLLACICITLLDFISTFSVPTDPLVLYERDCIRKNEKFDAQVVIKKMKNVEQYMFCLICKAHCLEQSKHCSQCDRCVYNFDHHCQWLNNCIGSNNYKYFFGLICMTTVMLITHMGICVYTIAYYFHDQRSFSLNIADYYNIDTYKTEYVNNAYILTEDMTSINETAKALFGLTWIILILEIPFLLGIGNLVVFHIFLIRSGQSTYEYITEKQMKQKKQEADDLKERMRLNGLKHREKIQGLLTLKQHSNNQSKLKNEEIEHQDFQDNLQNLSQDQLLHLNNSMNNNNGNDDSTKLNYNLYKNTNKLNIQQNQLTKKTSGQHKDDDVNYGVENHSVQNNKQSKRIQRSCYQRFRRNFVCCFFCCDHAKKRRLKKGMQYGQNELEDSKNGDGSNDTSRDARGNNGDDENSGTTRRKLNNPHNNYDDDHDYDEDNEGGGNQSSYNKSKLNNPHMIQTSQLNHQSQLNSNVYQQQKSLKKPIKIIVNEEVKHDNAIDNNQYLDDSTDQFIKNGKNQHESQSSSHDSKNSKKKKRLHSRNEDNVQNKQKAIRNGKIHKSKEHHDMENSFDKEMDEISNNQLLDGGDTEQMMIDGTNTLNSINVFKNTEGSSKNINQLAIGQKRGIGKKSKTKSKTSNIQNLLVNSGYANGIWTNSRSNINQQQQSQGDHNKLTSLQTQPFITATGVDKSEYQRNMTNSYIGDSGQHLKINGGKAIENGKLIANNKIHEPESEPPYQFTNKYSKYQNSENTSQQDIQSISIRNQALTSNMGQNLQLNFQPISQNLINNFTQNQDTPQKVSAMNNRFASQDDRLLMLNKNNGIKNLENPTQALTLMHNTKLKMSQNRVSDNQVVSNVGGLKGIIGQGTFFPNDQALLLNQKSENMFSPSSQQNPIFNAFLIQNNHQELCDFDQDDEDRISNIISQGQSAVLSQMQRLQIEEAQDLTSNEDEHNHYKYNVLQLTQQTASVKQQVRHHSKGFNMTTLLNISRLDDIIDQTAQIEDNGFIEEEEDIHPHDRKKKMGQRLKGGTGLIQKNYFGLEQFQDFEDNDKRDQLEDSQESVDQQNDESDEQDIIHNEQDDLKSKFEAIMCGSQAFNLMQYSEEEEQNDSQIEDPKNQIISEEHSDIFENHHQLSKRESMPFSHNQPQNPSHANKQKKTRNKPMNNTQVLRFGRGNNQNDSLLQIHQQANGIESMGGAQLNNFGQGLGDTTMKNVIFSGMSAGIMSPGETSNNKNFKGERDFSKVRRIHNFLIDQNQQDDQGYIEDNVIINASNLQQKQTNNNNIGEFQEINKEQEDDQQIVF
eukprot:403331826